MRAEPVGKPAAATKQQADVPRAAYWLATLPPLFWPGNFQIARLTRESIPPVQMSFWRWSLALLILVPFRATESSG